MPQNKTHHVTLTFAGHDLHPPIYVAGSFTHPPWHPHLMDGVLPEAQQQESGLNHVYTKSFEIPEGRYEYKFRLGDGDWWVCDPREETVKDARGNHNNLLLIGPEGGTTLAEEIPQQPKEQRAPMTAIDRVHSDNFEDDEDYEDAPLLSHEAPSLMTKDGLEVDPGQRGRRTSLGINISRVHTFVPPEPTHEDLKDPELEKFPENKSGILNRMHTLKHELPIDDSSHLDKNGNDPMAYHLSRSLADLKSKDTKQEVLFADFAKPKGTDKEDSESSRKSHQPFSSFFFWTDLTSGASGHLDGAVENAAIPLSQSPKPAEDALLRKPSSAEGSYGTIGPLFNGSESGASATARTKYASASALTVQNHLTNASIVDSHESVFTTVDEVSNDSRRDNRSNGISGGTPPWVDKVAVGVAMASICALLVGGWAFVSSRAHA